MAISFPARRVSAGGAQPISDKTVWHACHAAAIHAGLTKKIHPHTLRQAWAYYTTFQSPFILKTIGLDRRDLRKFMGTTTCCSHRLLHLRKQQILFLDDPWRVFHDLSCGGCVVE